MGSSELESLLRDGKNRQNYVGISSVAGFVAGGKTRN